MTSSSPKASSASSTGRRDSGPSPSRSDRRRMARATASTRNGRRLADREGLLGPLFLLPSVVYIVLLVALPFFLALWFSVTDVTTASPPRHFVGLDNFRAAWDDPVFRQSLRNTLIMTAVTMATVVV